MLVTSCVIYVKKEEKKKGGRKEGKEGGREEEESLCFSCPSVKLWSLSLLIIANWQFTKQSLQTYQVLDSFASLQN